MYQPIEKAPLLDQSTEKMRGGHLKSNLAADKGVSVYVSEDVRHYPVAEEEEEAEQGEEGQQEQQEQEPKREDKLHVMKNSQVDGSSNSQGESLAEKQRKNEDENDEAGRARIAKEWEAIDKVVGCI